MKTFFNVQDITEIMALLPQFNLADTEQVELADALGRINAESLTADINLPGFSRATMDGYAVPAASTFGSSEGNPACLMIIGSVTMGQVPTFEIAPGQAARIATGGMLPAGADSVVMLEHTDLLDDETLEVYRSVAPGQHVILPDEDVAIGDLLIARGQVLRPPEIGLLAAFGHAAPTVFCRPRIGIISSGDEVVPIHAQPALGQIRDINSHTLAAQVQEAGGQPVPYGIVADHSDTLYATCQQALAETDLVLISGGSSVGTRDFTLEVFQRLPNTTILAHGVAISPGKPTLLANSGGKAIWGLPGHVVSAMIVFSRMVKPFIAHIAGRIPDSQADLRPTARLTRNLASAMGRVDYTRVRLYERDNTLWAEPLTGKSGLIHTMVKAQGLIEIGRDVEGLTAGTEVRVWPM